MLCPNCSNTHLVMSERQGVEIDYCPNCRGVWLDRGELDKIIERSTGTQQAAGPAGHGAVHHDSHAGHGHGYNKPYKKKSFFEELFD